MKTDASFPSTALEPFLVELLAEQQRLDTPVARFSDAFDAWETGSPGPATTPSSLAFSKSLLPLTAPAPGEQYAFEVDLDSCTGCKSCVAACHSLNGLDEDETWRDVGLLVSANRRQPFMQTVTTACHHCEDPACLNGCPVLAYEKDPVTGIVRHLDDQCIGCSYCVLKCPYDVPKYSKRLGIVRKCDMCHGRLSHGEAPACAQACPTEAIRIVTVLRSSDCGVRNGAADSATVEERRSGSAEMRETEAEDGRRRTDGGRRIADGDPAEGRKTRGPDAQSTDDGERTADDGRPRAEDRGQMAEKPETDSIRRLSSAVGHPTFLPGAPDPGYTRPTTRYVSKRGLPAELVPADAAALRPQPAHAPLVVLLTLMALATGCSVMAAALTFLPAPGHLLSSEAIASLAASSRFVTYYVTRLGWAAGATGLAGSVLHLGQPRRAWRIFLGVRRSWLSREALVFGGWFATATVVAGFALPRPAGDVVRPLSGGLFPALRGGGIGDVLTLITAVLAVAGYFCSVMIYADTHRQFWRLRNTGPRFFGSAAVLGLGAALACGASSGSARHLAGALVAAIVLKLAFESQALAPLNGDRDTPTPALQTARLLVGPLRPVNEARIACGMLGGVVVPVLLATGSVPGWFAWPALGFVLAGELLERALFFRAVDAPKMPGMPG
ncbi:MAG TPA: DmsC/YnfH family molybdoenzyme membrane anchor subunit [Opitutaceae bacterium]|nr:DmsC/YnfH family molybdoenzyme membrane anchor subunit [Opitutaceae bacterium]